MKSRWHKFFALIIIVLGILIVTLIDQGHGLDSPGFWLIPMGVVYALFLLVQNNGLKRTVLPIVTWSLAFLFIIALYVDVAYELFFEGWDVFLWVYFAIGSALIALGSTVVLLFKKR